MRLTYLDEGGVSSREPYVVVAGPVVHGDLQLARVEDRLHELAEKYIPEPDRRGFVFHATDIWSGGKFFKDRNLWPLEKRLAILHDLADIPASFQLPITHGIADKEWIRGHAGDLSEHVLDAVYHAAAFSNATQDVERYFRDSYPTEYTLIIAEDRPRVRRMLKRVQSALQGHVPDFPQIIVDSFAELPFRHIRDTVHFAAKAESPLLQVADTCAFIIRGMCARHPHNPPLFARLAPALIRFQTNEGRESLKRFIEERRERSQHDEEG